MSSLPICCVAEEEKLEAFPFEGAVKKEKKL